MLSKRYERHPAEDSRRRVEATHRRAASSGVPSKSWDDRMTFVSSLVGPPPVYVYRSQAVWVRNGSVVSSRFISQIWWYNHRQRPSEMYSLF